VNPPTENFIDTSAPTEATQEQPVGQSPTWSDSLHNAISPSPPFTPQTPSQKSYRSDLISQENCGGSAETGESHNERPDAASKEMLQHPPPDAGDNRSESVSVSPENRDGSVRMGEGPNEKSHAGPAATLQDHLSRADYDSSGSRTDLQDTLSSRNVSRVGVSDEGFGELSVCKLVFAVAEIGVGSDFNFNRGSGGNDGGNYWSETQQDEFEASGMLLILTLPARVLHGWRFDSECRWRILPRWSRSRSLPYVYSLDYIPNIGDTPDRHGSTE